MTVNPIDWLVALLGVDRGLLWQKLLQLAAIWMVGWLAIRLVRLIARRIEAAVDDRNDAVLSAAEKRGQTIAQLVRSVGRVIVLLGVALLSLNLFLDIKPLLAGVGILSLAVSFGAQSLVKDVIAGFFMLVENQFVVGDVIQVGDKSGTVERMTLRVVSLRDLRGVVHVIPNGTITSVSNMTRSWARAVVDVAVGYETDLDRALAVVRDELTEFEADPAWATRLERGSEVLGVESLGDSGVVIRSAVRTAAGAQWEVAREFRRRLKNRFDHEGIEIPYPQRTVHVRTDGPPLPGGV
ncbi:MAG: mechanosensitive ion channel family protein [Gemmatimonadales bacterium]